MNDLKFTTAGDYMKKNERIKELAREAGMVNILDEHASEYGNGMFENTPYPEFEKFAELIVAECAGLCSDPVVVLQHFGLTQTPNNAIITYTNTKKDHNVQNS